MRPFDVRVGHWLRDPKGVVWMVGGFSAYDGNLDISLYRTGIAINPRVENGWENLGACQEPPMDRPDTSLPLTHETLQLSLAAVRVEAELKFVLQLGIEKILVECDSVASMRTKLEDLLQKAQGWHTHAHLQQVIKDARDAAEGMGRPAKPSEDVDLEAARMVAVDRQGVRFGPNCWVSHEKIMGTSAEHLNKRSSITHKAYMEWVDAMGERKEVQPGPNTPYTLSDATPAPKTYQACGAQGVWSAGYTCDAAVKTRERRPNGNSTCMKGHTFPTANERALPVDRKPD